MTQLFVLILAGGEGSRIGGGKPAHLLGGVSLLDRAVAIARQWNNDPVVAIRCGRDNGHPDARTVSDRMDLDGPLAGLAAGVEVAVQEHAEQLLLMPADMPFLPSDMDQRLAKALHQNADAGCAMAVSGGRPYPVCTLWRLSDLSVQLPAYAGQGRRSLHGLAEQLGVVPVEWESAGRDPFFNINDEFDLAAAESWLD